MNRPVWRLLLLLAFIVETYSLLPVRELTTTTLATKPYVEGIFHVHSRFSDGGGTVEEIAAAGNKAGMDFVVLTDHNTTEARRQGQERRYDKTDIFVEMEASTPSGHALCFYSQGPLVSLSDEEAVKACYQHIEGKKKDLFAITAHPSHVRNPWIELDRSTEGIEVMNFDSSWQRQLRQTPFSFLLTAMLIPFNEFLSSLRFFQFFPKDLSAWDTMNSFQEGHFGILAHDTHGTLGLSETLSVRWPDYDEMFRLAGNIVFPMAPLSQDFQERKKEIYRAIRKGRLAMHLRAIFPYEGNALVLRCGDKTYDVGDSVSLTPEKCEFEVSTPLKLPYAKRVRLVRNGETVTETSTEGPILRLPITSPGVYRVEVWVSPRSLFHILLNRDVPYVFYNPVYVQS